MARHMGLIDSLLDHARNAKAKTFRCPLCDSIYGERIAFAIHIKQRHRDG